MRFANLDLEFKLKFSKAPEFGNILYIFVIFLSVKHNYLYAYGFLYHKHFTFTKRNNKLFEFNDISPKFFMHELLRKLLYSQDTFQHWHFHPKDKSKIMRFWDFVRNVCLGCR